MIKFEEPKMEVIEFDDADIVTASKPGVTDCEGTGAVADDWFDK